MSETPGASYSANTQVAATSATSHAAGSSPKRNRSQAVLSPTRQVVGSGSALAGAADSGLEVTDECCR